MRKSIFITGLFTFLAMSSFAQLQTVSFAQLDSLQKIKPRNVIVFIKTDWCKYCHAMEQISFANKEVQKLASQKYYSVFFNAEEKNIIPFNGYQFAFKPTGNGTGLNELANQLSEVQNNPVFPALCFLNSKNEIIYQQSGYINPKDLTNILQKLN